MQYVGANGRPRSATIKPYHRPPRTPAFSPEGTPTFSQATARSGSPVTFDANDSGPAERRAL